MDVSSIHAFLRVDSGVRAASANGYRDVSAWGDPAINGVPPGVVLEQSASPVTSVLISYSLYLCHAATREVLWLWISREFPFRNSVAVFVTQMALAIPIASLLHYAVERPFLRLKDRFHKPRVTHSGALLA